MVLTDSESAIAAEPEALIVVPAVVKDGEVAFSTRRTNRTCVPFSGSGVKTEPFQLPRRFALRRFRMPVPP